MHRWSQMEGRWYSFHIALFFPRLSCDFTDLINLTLSSNHFNRENGSHKSGKQKTSNCFCYSISNSEAVKTHNLKFSDNTKVSSWLTFKELWRHLPMFPLSMSPVYLLNDLSCSKTFIWHNPARLLVPGKKKTCNMTTFQPSITLFCLRFVVDNE